MTTMTTTTETTECVLCDMLIEAGCDSPPVGDDADEMTGPFCDQCREVIEENEADAS